MSSTLKDRLMVRVALPVVLLLSVCNMIMIVIYSGRYNTSIGRSKESRETDGYRRKMTAKQTTKDEELFPDMVMQDDDIDQMIKQLNNSEDNDFFPSNFWILDMFHLTRQLGRSARQKAKTLPGYKAKPKANARNVSMSNWLKVHRNIRQYSLYDPDDPAIDALLHDMAHLPIIGTVGNSKGSTLKINLRLSDDGLAIMKPMRYERDVEHSPNITSRVDFERHIAEIASFQLDKILGFYRVPPTVGRRISLAELERIAPKNVKNTFYKSPAGNTCFYGSCVLYCDTAHAFCGKPDMIEVSLMSHLPSRQIAHLRGTRQPWQVNYSKSAKSNWEIQPDFCARLRETYPYNKGRILLDVIDFHTFDFLTGNMDRNSFSTFSEFGNFTFPIVFDNGQGFGRKTYDAMSNLAPVRQCCLIRKSTFLKYVKLYTGPEPLSVLMERALATDPVAPVLTRGHLTALDRRVLKILKEVAICLKTVPASQVIVFDDF